MAKVIRKKSSLPINPRMLRWARDYAGRTPGDAAQKINVSENKIVAWESEESGVTPTVRQARQLADFYNRAFLELFLPEPPQLPQPQLIPDFRLYAGVDNPVDSRALRDIQLWAETQRENALDLFTELGDEPAQIPERLFTTIDADVERASKSAREAIEFSLNEQVGLNANERPEIPSIIRNRIEGLGILTFRVTSLKEHRVRGFCVAHFPLPIIAFSNESPNAQSFTLAHEFAHVIIKQSAISGAIPRTGGEPNKRRVEEWCNRFAAAFLMPRAAVQGYIEPPPAPHRQFPEDILRNAADYFGVSRHAMLIRLVDLRYVQANYYWNVKKPEFDAEEAAYKRFGRPKYYGRRYISSLGNLYTSLVLDAWNTGRITNHNAAEFMGIRNFAHLKAIRDNFGG